MLTKAYVALGGAIVAFYALSGLLGVEGPSKETQTRPPLVVSGGSSRGGGFGFGFGGGSVRSSGGSTRSGTSFGSSGGK